MRLLETTEARTTARVVTFEVTVAGVGPFLDREVDFFSMDDLAAAWADMEDSIFDLLEGANPDLAGASEADLEVVELLDPDTVRAEVTASVRV